MQSSENGPRMSYSNATFLLWSILPYLRMRDGSFRHTRLPLGVFWGPKCRMLSSGGWTLSSKGPLGKSWWTGPFERRPKESEVPRSIFELKKQSSSGRFWSKCGSFRWVAEGSGWKWRLRCYSNSGEDSVLSFNLNPFLEWNSHLEQAMTISRDFEGREYRNTLGVIWLWKRKGTWNDFVQSIKVHVLGDFRPRVPRS